MKQILLLAVLASISVACGSKQKKEEIKTEEIKQEQVQQEAQPKQEMQVELKEENNSVDMEKGFPMVYGETRSQVNCNTGSDEREIKVIDTKEGSCGVVYKKFGQEKTVALAKFEMNFCDQVSSNIQTNLSKGGLSCSGDMQQTAEIKEESNQEEVQAVETTEEQSQGNIEDKEQENSDAPQNTEEDSNKAS